MVMLLEMWLPKIIYFWKKYSEIVSFIYNNEWDALKQEIIVLALFFFSVDMKFSLQESFLQSWTTTSMPFVNWSRGDSRTYTANAQRTCMLFQWKWRNNKNTGTFYSPKYSKDVHMMIWWQVYSPLCGSHGHQSTEPASYNSYAWTPYICLFNLLLLFLFFRLIVFFWLNNEYVFNSIRNWYG